MRLIVFLALALLLSGCTSELQKNLMNCKAELNNAETAKQQAIDKAVKPLNERIAIYKDLTKAYELTLATARQGIYDAGQAVSHANYCEKLGRFAFYCDKQTHEMGNKLQEKGYMPDFITSFTYYALTFLSVLVPITIPFALWSFLGFSRIKAKNKELESLAESTKEKEKAIDKKQEQIKAQRANLSAEIENLNKAIRAKKDKLNHLSEAIIEQSSEIERLNKVKQELSQLESLGSKF